MRMRRIALAAAVLLPAMLAATTARGQTAAKDDRTIAATVGDEPIYRTDVARVVGQAARGRAVNPAVEPWLQAEALAQLVDRRLVTTYARQKNLVASRADVEKALAALKSQLVSQGESLKEFLAKQSFDENALRRRIAWQLSFKNLLARYATERRVAAHFQQHRRQFDGTTVLVAHVLLQPAAGAGPEAIDSLVARAGAIREQIIAGKLSFAEAARKHSAGPSAAHGGRLGNIARHGSMSEAFSRAAFALNVGEVSQPVRSPFGVHLIQVSAINPGEKSLEDVRPQVIEALGREMSTKLAEYQRAKTPVRFSGKAPHFKPGSRDLVVP